MTPDHIAAVLLAGGEARRMNRRDKGLLPFGQQSLAQRVLERLQQQIDMVVIVANRNTDVYRQLGVPVISDWDEREGSNDSSDSSSTTVYQGPLRGIYRAMRYYQSLATVPEWLLLAPCDAPNYPADLLQRYLSALAACAPGTQCLIPNDGKRLQPLFALLHMSCIRSIESALNKKEFAMMDWLHHINYTQLDMPRDYFHNINYPEQLKG